MASEILFRCWDSDSKKMYHQDDENYIQLYTENKYSMFDYSDNIVVTNIINEKNVFMQYIGWNDKHKKKIYYGDIVKYKAMWDDDDNEWGTAIVHRFINNGVGLLRRVAHMENTILEGKPYKNTYASWNGELVNIWYEQEVFDLCVVGNIFETPHLINN